MKVVVVGPGALGCLFAALLREHGNRDDVCILDHDRARAAFLEKQGIYLEDSLGPRSRCVKVGVSANVADIGPADCILLCVKSHALERTLPEIAQLCHADSLAVSLQNGIAHLHVLQSWNNPSARAAGITAQGATLLGPGRIRHAGKGLTRLGFLEKPAPMAEQRLEELAGVLRAAGIDTTVEDDILPHVWSKLLVNAGINALTAIHGCSNGDLVERDDLRDTMIAAVREAAAVAAALGIALVGDPEERVREVARATAANISSMLQDVRKPRKTEIEAINGEIVRAGKSVGVAVPVNEELLRRVLALERSALDEKRTFS